MRHQFIVELQDNTWLHLAKAHCVTSSVDLNCIGIASLIEQKRFPTSPGEYIDPRGEARNKTMFLQEEL